MEIDFFQGEDRRKDTTRKGKASHIKVKNIHKMFQVS